MPKDSSDTSFEVMEHMQQHAPFVCDIPGCSFSAILPVDLDLHKKNIHSWSNFLNPCLLCGKNFLDEMNLKIHMAMHNTETPGVFKCLHWTCHKLFENAGNLRKHTQDAHKDLKQCNLNLWSVQCKSSKFRPESDLKNTIWTFKCEFCGKGFDNKSRYQKHLHKHETDTPSFFKCLHLGCHKTFSVPADLTLHMIQTPNGHIYKCEIPHCLFSCKSLYDLQVHKNYVHSNETCQPIGKGYLWVKKTKEPSVIKKASAHYNKW